jgi:hypothetical protein
MSQAYVSGDLRRLVRQRSAETCEYCLVPESHSFFPHEIDHITAQQHGGETVESNLALSCVLCNKYKGTNLTSIDPQTGQIVSLFHPRRDRWLDHFRLNSEQIEPLTPAGRATARLLQFNLPSRLIERKALLAAGVLRVER